jgi:signal peptidase I
MVDKASLTTSLPVAWGIMLRAFGGAALGVLGAAVIVGYGSRVINVQAQTAAGVHTQALSRYREPSGSMEPTITIGTRVFVQTEGITPKVGSIVVFHPPAAAQQEQCGPTPHTIKLGGAACRWPVPKKASVKFLKRIVAGPGDVISIHNGYVIRNSKRERHANIRQCHMSPECNFPVPIRIPAGHWFMLGDNRGESVDSRFWGPVPTAWIIGDVLWCSTIGHSCG